MLFYRDVCAPDTPCIRPSAPATVIDISAPNCIELTRFIMLPKPARESPIHDNLELPRLAGRRRLLAILVRAEPADKHPAGAVEASAGIGWCLLL